MAGVELSSAVSAGQETAVIATDCNVTHQSMVGFGATATANTSEFADYLTSTQRQEAIRQVYGEIKLTTGKREIPN